MAKKWISWDDVAQKLPDVVIAWLDSNYATDAELAAAKNNISKISGVTISGVPAVGQVPSATSSTTAAWAAPAGGGGGSGAVGTLAYTASITPDASVGSNFKITATGNFTLNPPTNPTEGQMLQVQVRASGASRTVTLAAGITLTTGLTNTLAVASGKSGYIGMRYSTDNAAWTLLASTAGL